MTPKITKSLRVLTGLLHDPKRHLLFGQALPWRAVDQLDGAGIQRPMKAEIARLIQCAPFDVAERETKTP